MCSIMSSSNSDSLASSFPVWVPFTYVSSLTAITRISKTMFSKSGESAYHFLFPDLRGNAFSFLPLSMMLAVVLSYVAFIMLR